MQKENDGLINTLKTIVKENIHENLQNLGEICPFCFEKIKPNAVKCKHCGEWLNQSKNEKKWLAIASLVLGIFSVFFGSIGIIPLVALTISIISMFYLSSMKKQYKIFAVIGLILSIVYTINFYFVYSGAGPNILNIGY